MAFNLKEKYPYIDYDIETEEELQEVESVD